MDDEEYITVKDFIVRCRTSTNDKIFCSSWTPRFLTSCSGVETRDSESMFDFGLSSKIYDIIAKLVSHERANVPKRQTYYGLTLSVL